MPDHAPSFVGHSAAQGTADLVVGRRLKSAAPKTTRNETPGILGMPATTIAASSAVEQGGQQTPPLPSGFLVSVVIPAFNEERTMAEVIDRVRGCGLPCEIIVVDDGSTDRTGAVLDGLAPSADLRVVHQRSNQGKGAALKLGFQLARGSVVIVQDADLEYDPAEYQQLIQPITSGQADVVFGSRFPKGFGQGDGTCHRLGNRLLTLLSNAANNLRLVGHGDRPQGFPRRPDSSGCPHAERVSLWHRA